MAWLYIRLPGGTVKVKPRSHLRSMETNRQVPVLDLGVIVLSWWNHEHLKQDAAERGVPPPKGGGHA